MNVMEAGKGKVYLLTGGGKIYSEAVAKFCRSEKSVEEIMASPYVKEILNSLIESGHQAALEFDDYIFGIEGYARVTEVQLVRKRHASYMIKSGTINKGGKRSYDVVIPNSIKKVSTIADIPMKNTYLKFDKGDSEQKLVPISAVAMEYVMNHTQELVNQGYGGTAYSIISAFDTMDLLSILEQWYDNGVAMEVPENDLRYMKPQATEFKAAIKMNASGLYDWFQIRLCNRAQFEIRDLAWKMYWRLMEVHPDIFEKFGPKCKVLGYCPETEQCNEFKGVVPTKEQALAAIREKFGNNGAGPIQKTEDGEDDVESECETDAQD